MSQAILYLRLNQGGDACQWMLISTDGKRRSGCGGLDEAAGHAAGTRLAVLIPSTDVTIAQVTLPPVKRSQQRQAAIFALEDHLIDDPAELHAALGERNEDGSLPLIVVSRSQMAKWLAQLAEHQLRPDQLLVDVLALPLPERGWSLLWEERGILLRTGEASGYTLETEQWPLLWPRILAAAAEQPPQQLRVFDGRQDAAGRLPLDNALSAGSIDYRDKSAVMNWLEGMGGRSINLLQGEYGKREQWGKIFRPWRPAAALLIVWLALQGVMALYDLHHLRHEEEQLDQQMADLYRTTFPDARKVVDPLAQMKQRLRAMKSGDNGFMALIASAAPALTGQGIQMKGLRYQDGALDLDIAVTDMATLDTLRSALSAKGLRVEIGNTANQDGRVVSRLTLHGGAA